MSDEHRWPKKERGSFPTYFALWYSWRRVVFQTPKVGLRAWQIVVSPLPSHGRHLFGLHLFREEDDDLVVTLGLGFIEVEVNTLRFHRPKPQRCARCEGIDSDRAFVEMVGLCYKHSCDDCGHTTTAAAKR